MRVKLSPISKMLNTLAIYMFIITIYMVCVLLDLNTESDLKLKCKGGINNENDKKKEAKYSQAHSSE